MESEHHNQSNIRPEIAVQILAKNGIKVNVDEAKNILELLFFLVNLSVDQLVDQDKKP
ncbi:hypothetical protein BDD43_2007 [Mucilaginibacter gracilis]|uniref:Uncharacterized protein n=1 Tax=Mucilaginibacter gracilis TaxID=423350 RepID=A0A495IYT9_9SPHI|nr:hypothetical protein [Mucilaginibacter gracilis]RKR81847.1 hypothetical protein BDD43_2007 [Mucilaginibacter gracilis]